MTLLRLVRFFVALRLQPPYAIVTLAAVAALGVWTIATSVSELDSALGMVLFMHMFLSSSGFLHRARRGHFDPVLIGPAIRTRAVIAHCLASSIPGACAWLALSLVIALNGGSVWSVVTGHRGAAFVLVSLLSWSGGFALPRGAAGLLWIAGLIALLLRHVVLITAAADGTAPVLQHAAFVLVCPFLLLTSSSPIGTREVCAALAVALALVLLVWRRAAKIDICLMEAP